MRRLIPAHRWIREVFPEGGVTTTRVRGWIVDGVIPGVVIDSCPFVDADQAALLLDTNRIITRETGRKPPTGNSRVAGIVQAAMIR